MRPVAASPGHQRRPRPATWLLRLLLVLVVLQTSIQLARPVTSYRVLALGGGALEIGYTTAAFAALPLVASMPLGRLVDRWRPGPLIALGAAMVAGAGLLLARSDDVLDLALGNALLGMGALCLMVPAQALIARRSDDKDHDRDYGLFAAAVGLGQLFGPAAAGAILSLFPGDTLRATGVAFLACSVTGAVALAATWRLDSRPAHRPAATGGPEHRSTVALLRAPGVPASVLASLTLIASVDILTAYLPLIGEQQGIAPGTVGLLLSLRAATSIASRMFLAQLVARWSRVGLLVTSTAASAVLLALVALPLGTVALGVVLAVLGLVAGIGQPLTMSYLVGLTPVHERGAALGLRFTGNRLGQAVLPLAAGAIAADAGLSVAIIVVAGLLGGCSWLLRREKRGADP